MHIYIYICGCVCVCACSQIGLRCHLRRLWLFIHELCRKESVFQNRLETSAFCCFLWCKRTKHSLNCIGLAAANNWTIRHFQPQTNSKIPQAQTKAMTHRPQTKTMAMLIKRMTSMACSFRFVGFKSEKNKIHGIFPHNFWWSPSQNPKSLCARTCFCKKSPLVPATWD